MIDWKKLLFKEADPPLNKPFRTPDGPKKFAVYVNDDGKRKKVTFGDPNMSIKRDDPDARKNFRARHGCDKATDKTSAKYWSCKMWSKKPVSKITKEDDKTGIRQNFWFYGSEIYAKKMKAAKPEVGEPKAKPLTNPEPEADRQVNKIVAENPGISGATLVNTIKSKGLAIVDQKEKIEADTLSTGNPVLRDDMKKKKKYKGKERAKELRAQESLRDSFINVRFMESSAKSVSGNKFKVALIQEGLGNLRDGFYYSADAIKSAVPAFEGKKCYADHPSRFEEQDRPERSVRDIIGHFENVHVQENEDGSVALCADLIVLPDQPYEWARALVRQAVDYSEKYPDKDFVGLSINAAGDAEPIEADRFLKERSIPESCKPKLLKAIEEGLTQVRVVNTIRDAISTDLVTEAGARGRVLEIMENNKEAEMAKKDILPKEAEEEMKQKHESEDEAQDAPSKDEHADEEQDKKLILDMIKKHMGDDEMDEEECKAAEAACEAYQEMGMKQEEACQAAAHSMKLAKHMAAKQSMESESEEEKKESENEKMESEDEAKKESSAMKLEARIAMLESELKKRDLVVYLDKKLAESKLPRSVTDKIREKKLRSEKEVDEAIKIYVEAFKEAGYAFGGESRTKSNIFVTSTEKTPSISSKGSKISFTEMLKK
ncbi:hypothetical protein EBZ39_11130 [bacterium]|nr:hypothetical protein [bacterium]